MRVAKSEEYLGAVLTLTSGRARGRTGCERSLEKVDDDLFGRTYVVPYVTMLESMRFCSKKTGGREIIAIDAANSHRIEKCGRHP